ncbi:MAG TPA: DHA2 family efflux MFS transporter permease subunit [Solirubrobacteraceae bacterium]|nr:DHA2 family efflux MFS transporter permease subunit [Solirubrobacteraceae bacterium]
MDPSAPHKLDPHVRKIATVIVLGAIMSILDTTIINVALNDLANDFDAPLSTIQWISTGYMLAVAAALPVTGWASRRFGSKRLYIVAVVLFTLGSALCALAWSANSLILFRVLQGLGGGMIMPVGQMILVRAAGPKSMPRVMAAIGVPMLVAPVLGPTIGGLLLEHAGWQWIFLINLPVGIIALITARRLLPSTDDEEPAGRLDFAGLALASAGFVGITYGLAQTGSASSLLAASVVVPIAAGLVLVAAFVVRALRISYPLLNVRLFRSGSFSAAAVAVFFLGAALFGAMILMPLYFQVARGESAAMAGLLLAPQGIGAAVGMRLSARTTERVGAGRTTLLGVAVIIVGTIPLLSLADDTSYGVTSAALILRGIGMGLSLMPAMTSAYSRLSIEQVSHATPQLLVLQRVGGSMGTALLSVILQDHLTSAGRSPAGMAHAFALTNWWVIAITVAAVVPVIVLALTERATEPGAGRAPMAIGAA